MRDYDRIQAEAQAKSARSLEKLASTSEKIIQELSKINSTFSRMIPDEDLTKILTGSGEFVATIPNASRPIVAHIMFSEEDPRRLEPNICENSVVGLPGDRLHIWVEDVTAINCEECAGRYEARAIGLRDH